MSLTDFKSLYQNSQGFISLFIDSSAIKFFKTSVSFIEEDLSCYKVHQIIIIPLRRPLTASCLRLILENQKFSVEDQKRYNSFNNMLNCLIVLKHGVMKFVSSNHLW